MSNDFRLNPHPIHLIVQYYKCASPPRQVEIDTCLRENLLNPFIETVHLLTEQQFDFSEFPNHKKIIQTVISERLTFEKAFRYANEFDSPAQLIWMISNADIYFDNTLRFVEWDNLDNVVYAMTRHDVQPDGILELVPSEFAHGCQDAWIFRAPVPVDKMFTSFCIGIAGCDHRIAHEFAAAGYAVANPCLSIILRHLDLSQTKDIYAKTREYVEWMNEEGYKSGKVVSPPYLYCLYPTEQFVYPDPNLQRKHVIEASTAFQKENELKTLLAKEQELRAVLKTQLSEQIKILNEELAERDKIICELRLITNKYAEKILGFERSTSWRMTWLFRFIHEKITSIFRN